MNIYKEIEDKLRVIIEDLKRDGTLLESVHSDKVEATPTRDISHGEVATNAAMVLAAQMGKNPREIANLLLERINALPAIEKVEIAGPGFINMTLAPSAWQKVVADILAQGCEFGDSDIGKGIKVNVEYVSANPTGPMHVGHGRGAVFGDALATLLQKAGYDVTREYYINDAGAQVDKLADSAFLRYREACGEAIGEIPEGLYPGEYLIPVGQALHKQFGTSLLEKHREAWLETVRRYALDSMMIMIREDLLALGIRHDMFVSERDISKDGNVERAIAVLEQKGLIYTGVLEPPKGKTPDDWEPRPQTLFRSTEFGDDLDRAVKKSDASWTYFAPDIAYHYHKCQRGYGLLIDIFGADHGGYVKRIKSAVNALSGGQVTLEVKLMQMIKLMRGGEPAKMSKRAGNFVTIREVIDEVGKDVFRFIMLTRKNDAPLDFDFAKVMEQSKDNPVFYVQYAHARARSVIRRAEEDAGFRIQDSGSKTSSPNPESRILIPALHRLTHPAELALMRLMAAWPRMVESAAAALEPHRIAFYLHDLAASFHGFWNLGNDDISLRFLIKDDIELTAARVALAQAVSLVIASGLNVLGVEPVEEMR